ncbi:hypothetical protein AB6E94_19690 [Vibrio lentus]|uniref:hypothetical protein n=1 Tax=Vibrio splendidus TaxID=29497 RepID=UPI000C834D14|nr:hypothetical protein [Vibrio splendidus]PMG17928.1 hypothetical protein BCU98_00920 [Vibrio splendidus]
MIKACNHAVLTLSVILFTTPVLAITPPRAPALDGLAQGETNWIKVVQLVSENSMMALGLIFSAALTVIMIGGIVVALFKELVTKEGGTGKMLLFSLGAGAVGMTVGAYLINDLMTMLGKS